MPLTQCGLRLTPLSLTLPTMQTMLMHRTSVRPVVFARDLAARAAINGYDLVGGGTGDQESSHTRHCMPWKLMGRLVAMGTKNRNVPTTRTPKATTTHGPAGWRLQRKQSQ